jgi:hypothetical protein
MMALALASGGCSRPIPDDRPSEETPPGVPEVKAEATDELWRRISKAYADGAGKIEIPPGTYRLKAPAGEPWCLPFRDLKNFTIDATGSTFVVAGRDERFVLFEDCDGVTLKGGTVIRETPGFSQGVIESIAADRQSLEIRICDGYPADIDDTKFFAKIPVINVFPPGSRLLKPGVPDLYINGIERLKDGRFRFLLRNPLPVNSPAKAGDFAAWRGTVRADVALRFSRNMRVEGVTIKGGVGMVFHEACGEGGNRFANCRITYGARPPGATIDPLLSSNADGFRSSTVRAGFTLENCHAEGLNDDGIAVHGAYGMVIEQRDGSLIVASRPGMSNRSGGNPFCVAGDRFRVYDTQGVFVAEAKARTVKARPGFSPPAPVKTSSRFFGSPEGLVYSEVILETPVALKPGWFVANIDAIGSGFVIRNCSVKNLRARGMLLHGDNGRVEDCQVEHTLNAGILVFPEILWWNESDYVHNLTIRNNVIRNAGLASQPFSGALTVAAFEHGQYVASPSGHRHVLIENNVFEDNNGINLMVSSASDVQIRGNRFIRPMHGPEQNTGGVNINYGALIWLAHVNDIVLEDNSVEAPGSYLKKLVERTGSVVGRGFEDGVRAP